tara:strand:- start:69 stop:269 length:201 start_codon:yes stop_codon:yes gene_type:complete
MSLKAFHIFFISVSTLFAIWFGVWSLSSYFSGADNGMLLVLAIFSFIVAGVLIVYGIKVFQKLKKL